MRRTTCLATVLGLATLTGVASLAAAIPAPPPTAAKQVAVAKVGEQAPAFTMKDLEGKEHSLADFKGKIVVLEWFCPTCPYSGGKSRNSIHTTGQVKRLHEDLKKVDEDVVYLTIDSSTHKMRMSAADLTKKDADLAKELGIKTPILIDADTSVAKAYNAKTTPHCYVIDGEGVLRYMGAFSDQAETNYVLKAVTAIKGGETVSPAETRPFGCGVKVK